MAPFQSQSPRLVPRQVPRQVPRLAAAHGFTEAEVAALRALPGFDRACRLACLSGIELYEGNRLINLLLGDRGRSAISFFCLYLHSQRDPRDRRTGLTVTRLKAVCADQNVASPGRIEAFAVLMRVLGFLQQVRGDTDRRVRQLMPTERLYKAHRDRWFALLAVMSDVIPEAVRIRDEFRDEAFERAFLRRSGDRFLAGFRPLADRQARALFGDRNAGLMVAFSLMTAGGSRDFPPRQPVTLSISKLARQFGVSRVHVRKLLRDAAQAGYIARPDDDNAGTVVLPPLHDVVGNFFANMFLVLSACACDARADIAAMSLAKSA